jgi:hypothetical protein
VSKSRLRKYRYALGLIPAAAAVAGLMAPTAALASGGSPSFENHVPLLPGNLLVSGSVYQNDPSIVAGSTQLPPGCATGTCATAIAGGAYPYVFNNDTVDASFGITSNIFLEEMSPSGNELGDVQVPSGPGGDQMVTSFSSKSELALNLSTSGKYVTFVGYSAPVGSLDVSNSNTPSAIDPTNPVTGAYYRVVAQLGENGKFHFTETNAYSGNNGRAAILNDQNGADAIYSAGNAGNGANPQPEGVVLGAGAQILQPSLAPEADQNPGQPTPVGSFSVTQLGDSADKVGKDDNFRGLTIHDNVLYYTKGSGSNGVDTVYFLDTTGKACPTGVGLPEPGASLPTATLAYDATTGLEPNNMCILKGFPTILAKKSTSSFPFGIWFANADTLYVADEGDGSNTYSTMSGQYSAAAASTTAGLQKWTFNAATSSWELAYTLQSGLGLGLPYSVADYPTGDNSATGLPWAPATDGLRNITGRTNPDGTATIWGITSTVSGSGDQGADPNKLVAITDRLDVSALPAAESFHTVRSAVNASVLRGVTFTPHTNLAGSGN